jgi:hypothetical protein
MASDEPFFFCPLGCLIKRRRQTSQWTKEKGLIRGHKEKKGRQANGQKRKGSSEAIKRRRADNPMEKRERGHQRS